MGTTMLKLKVCYNFPEFERERCQVIFRDRIIKTFEHLMEVTRGKIESFQFITQRRTGRANGRSSMHGVVCQMYQEQHFAV